MDTLTALITRPEPEATQLSQTLIPLGIDSVMAPMLTVQFDTQAPRDLSRIQPTTIRAIVFTSSNAIRSVATITSLFSIPCVCVGNNTAETARITGFVNIHSTDGDVETLLAYITTHFKPENGTLLYISGVHTAGNLTETLKKKHYSIQHFCTYETHPVTQLSPDLHIALTQQHIDIALFYSSRTAEVFNTLLTNYNMQIFAESIEVICLSKNIAKRLHGLPWKRIHVAEYPNNTSMLELIRNFRFINNSSTV